MQQTFIERVEKTREQIKNWSTQRLDELQERQEALLTKRDELVKQGEERIQEGQKALQEKREAIKARGTDVLDSAQGAVAVAEATVLEAARDLLARASDSLGDRATFLARGQEALDEALVALRAGHRATLPVEGFETLSVKKATAQLAGLDIADLKTLRAYEVANKNRVTLLRELDRRLDELVDQPEA